VVSSLYRACTRSRVELTVVCESHVILLTELPLVARRGLKPLKTSTLPQLPKARQHDASRRSLGRGHNAGGVLQAAVVAVRRGAEKRRLPARRHLEGQSRPPLHAIDATTQ